jgi:hypothetical protein
MISTTFRSQLLVCAAIVSTTAIVFAQANRAADNDPDQKEIYNYVLTLDKIQKLGAVQKDLDTLSKSNPQMAKNMDNDSDSKTINDMVRNIEKYPPVVAVLKKDGLTPREYAVCTMTLLQAGMAVGFKKAGTYKEYPPEMLKVVSPANLSFVEQHYDEITKAMPAMSGNDADKQ